jgi:hypothetical protein
MGLNMSVSLLNTSYKAETLGDYDIANLEKCLLVRQGQRISPQHVRSKLS